MTSGEVVVGVHAFLEPEGSSFERPRANAPGGVYTYVHEAEAPPGPTAAGAQAEASPPLDADSAAVARALRMPTLCLKLKRREAIESALSWVRRRP